MANAEPQSASSGRVHSVDIVRGLVMALMVIDHTRDYLTSPLLHPEDIEHTTVPLFLTRWITHFCAPVFVFLSGVSAWLQQNRRGWTTAETARHLATRGAWLMFLDIFVLRVLWWFNFDYRLTMASVLFAIGAGMVILAACLWLGPKALAGIGLGMMVGHNALDGVSFAEGSPAQYVWSILHVQTMLALADGWYCFVGYPLIPWAGVVMFGYGLGSLFQKERAERRRQFLTAGTIFVVAFFVVRGSNLYGDPNPWSKFDEDWRTVLSFLNCAKYPPSLCYLLMTLGPMFLLLAALDSEREPRLARPLKTLGQAPLFFYLLHLPMAHLAGIAFSLYRYGEANWWFRNPNFGLPDDYGWGIPAWYAVAATIVALLIPACDWYVSQRRKSNSFLFRWV